MLKQGKRGDKKSDEKLNKHFKNLNDCFFRSVENIRYKKEKKKTGGKAKQQPIDKQTGINKSVYRNLVYSTLRVLFWRRSPLNDCCARRASSSRA
jgi:hypothetical protein